LFVRFRDEVTPFIRPLDDATDSERETLLGKVLRLACEYKIFSLALPRSFGGQGCSMLALSIGLEQLAQSCAGLASLLGTHGLALAIVGSTGNVRWLQQLAGRLIEDERRGQPYLLSTAATEPSAGSDIEDFETLRRARIESQATEVLGGYCLSGTKIYVSNGSLASAHIVVMPTDRTRPQETLSAFIVPKGQPGVHVVRTEHKLGQRASPAAELRFDDCFVPETLRLNESTLAGRSLDLVLGASRSFVGAFGAGIARGVYETCRSRVDASHGKATLLAQMWQNARTARASYLEANIVNAQVGLVSLSDNGLARLIDRLMPPGLARSRAVERLINLPYLNEQARRIVTSLSARDIAFASSYGSATKVETSELALRNCELSFELLGAKATREDTGLPKYWRDARLLTIYEGTNDICRLDVTNKQTYLNESAP
jgi:alkylation response protein AidB-like acyl-CoA dehydrogenase